MSIQELVLDFVNVKGQELSSKVEENQSIEADLQQINDMWNNVQELVTERTKELKGIVAELSDFEEELGRLGDILNYTEVCLDESSATTNPGYNGLQNQLAKMKVRYLGNNFFSNPNIPTPLIFLYPDLNSTLSCLKWHSGKLALGQVPLHFRRGWISSGNAVIILAPVVQKVDNAIQKSLSSG